MSARRSRVAGDAATPAPPATPSPVTVEVGEDGAFSTPYELTTGRWAITVTASSPEGKTASLTRNVSVAFKGVNLVVNVKGGKAWIKVWVDGKIDDKVGLAGKVIGSGKTLTFTGKEIDRSPDRVLGRHLLHAQRHVPRVARPQRRARRPGCSRRPTNRSRPSAADERAPDRRRAAAAGEAGR